MPRSEGRQVPGAGGRCRRGCHRQQRCASPDLDASWARYFHRIAGGLSRPALSGGRHGARRGADAGGGSDAVWAVTDGRSHRLGLALPCALRFSVRRALPSSSGRCRGPQPVRCEPDATGTGGLVESAALAQRRGRIHLRDRGRARARHRRNQIVSHHDVDATIEKNPHYDIALKAACFMFDRIRAVADQDWLGGIPRDLDRWFDTDLAYSNIRAPKREGAAIARANCDALWRDFEPYASAHFLSEFPFRFHQRWFEMYLAVALLRAGLEISCPKDNAPDVRVQHRDGRVLWLEAVAPTGGDESNPDRVVYSKAAPGETSVAYYVPTQKITLRVSGALHDKAKKLKTYREQKVVAPDDQALVAISVSGIPHGFYDAETYGLAVTYGVGPQFVVIDRESGEAVDSGFHHRPELQRGSGSPVDVAPFLRAEFAHITGALVSSVDAANCAYPPGLEFMLFPNPHGAPPYTERQLPVGREWRLLPLGEGGYQTEVIEHAQRISILRLFHATTQENARKILANGFVDGRRELHRGRWYSGVWLSDVTLEELAPVMLMVSLPEELVRQYELSGDQGYRRWLVPAEVIDRHATPVEFPRRRERGLGSPAVP